MLKSMNNSVLLAMAAIFGVFCGYLNISLVYSWADIVSEIFIKLLKLVSLPIIFLSIVSTASGMESLHEFKRLGKRVFQYTILTTVIAATVALGLFLVINPVGANANFGVSAPAIEANQGTYLTYLMKVIPSNFLEPFIENNAISVLFLALVLSLASLALPEDNRVVLHDFFRSLYAAVMKVTAWIIRLMPLAIWAFVTLFLRDIREGLDAKNLVLYLAVVVIANLVQAMIVLPAFLKVKGISPLKLARGMAPALSVAFFSKSSSAALPMAVRCAEERVGVSRKIAGFALPLCTTINMNACAAFILTTVLFVSMSNGVTYTPLEFIIWIGVATIAAVGNAGVPMGCYFMSTAFLAAMNVPLHILGAIMPFYALIDMLESAINVWSDSCVTAVVQRDINQQEFVLSEVR